MHPAFSTSDLEVKRRRHTTLKRLDFVRAYTEYYWSKANTIAQMVCSSTISFRQPSGPLCVYHQSLRPPRAHPVEPSTLAGSLKPHLRQSTPQEACRLRRAGDVAQVYTSSRAFVPSALSSSVRVVEDKVSELSTPLLAAVQTRSEQVLTSLDRKVTPSCSQAATSFEHAFSLRIRCACTVVTALDPWAACIRVRRCWGGWAGADVWLAGFRWTMRSRLLRASCSPRAWTPLWQPAASSMLPMWRLPMRPERPT